MKLRLTDFSTNTYEDTDGSCDICMYTGPLDHPEFEFTDSNGGVHVIEGWVSDWGHHSVLYDVNVPVFAHWLHGVVFKAPEDVVEQLSHYTYKDVWESYLNRILSDASYCGTEEELNEALAWALV